jgi:hypothetical protein
MHWFMALVARQNVKHFRNCLWSERDPAARARLQKLLVAEENKLGRLGENLKLAVDIDRHITDGNRRIERQRAVVAIMKRDGHSDLRTAQGLLDGMIEGQLLHVKYRERVLIAIKQNAPEARNASPL